MPPRGRISQHLLREIEREYDSGEIQAIERRIRALARRGAKKLLKHGGAVGSGPNAKPEGQTLVEAALTYARAEEAVEALRERRMKNVDVAERLAEAILGGKDGESNRPVITIVYPSDKTEPPAGGGSPGTPAGE